MVQKIQKKPSAETKGFIGAALTGTKLLPCRLNIKPLFFEESFWIFEFSTFHSFQINQLPEERRGLARHGHPLQLGRVFDGTDEVGVLAHQVGQSQRHHHRRESTADEPLTVFFYMYDVRKVFLKMQCREYHEHTYDVYMYFTTVFCQPTSTWLLFAGQKMASQWIAGD